MNELIMRWLFAIRGESAEPPVFIRFDLLVKYLGNGECRIMTGELTELGGTTTTCYLVLTVKKIYRRGQTYGGIHVEMCRGSWPMGEYT